MNHDCSGLLPDRTGGVREGNELFRREIAIYAVTPPLYVFTCAFGQFLSVFNFEHIRLKLSSCSARNLRQFFDLRLSSYDRYGNVYAKNTPSVTVNYA